jgi:hypothetical protein
MAVELGEQVTIGQVSIPVAVARDWVACYTDPENTDGPRPYAYPAYDEYNTDSNDPLRITDADLLAPTLLNVAPTVRAFYGLQRVRPLLEQALANPDLAHPLGDLDDPERIAAMVKPLYAVLDDPATKPPKVRATLLSKVLHRKRPQSIVLHDKWVKSCYLGPDGPIRLDPNRSWADYMAAVTLAIWTDLRRQRELFAQLDAATSHPGTLSHVRLLDILAWTSRGIAP